MERDFYTYRNKSVYIYLSKPGRRKSANWIASLPSHFFFGISLPIFPFRNFENPPIWGLRISRFPSINSQSQHLENPYLFLSQSNPTMNKNPPDISSPPSSPLYSFPPPPSNSTHNSPNNPPFLPLPLPPPPPPPPHQPQPTHSTDPPTNPTSESCLPLLLPPPQTNTNTQKHLHTTPSPSLRSQTHFPTPRSQRPFPHPY